MNEKNYNAYGDFFITEEFKKELQNLGCSYADKISVYKREHGKVFFRVGQCKFHLTQSEFEEAIV